jgi:hypothetical protein
MLPVTLFLLLLTQAPSLSSETPAPAAAPAERPWPCTLGVPRELRAGVDELWQSSPTFRRQCVRIAEADVTIALQVAPARTRTARALSSINRREGRVFYVSVALKDARFISEDLPHELEHVLEQIEGQNLAAEVRAGRAIWIDSMRAYETDRARKAGKQALQEIRASRDPSAPLAVVAGRDE